jgi:hypothetical protein
VPTYHPAAVLRGGGETVAQMRADLVRAKQLLAGVPAKPAAAAAGLRVEAAAAAPQLFA